MLLDEPFAGIDPIAVGDIQALVRHLTNRGIGVLITDHNVRETLGLTDRAYIIYSGEVLMEGHADEIVNNLRCAGSIWVRSSGFKLYPRLCRCEEVGVGVDDRARELLYKEKEARIGPI